MLGEQGRDASAGGVAVGGNDQHDPQAREKSPSPVRLTSPDRSLSANSFPVKTIGLEIEILSSPLDIVSAQGIVVNWLECDLCARI